jgi:glucose/arabinose dehydrogenase
MSRPVVALICTFLLTACDGSQGGTLPNLLPFGVTPVANFDEPWAMTFLPDGALLVTEKDGKLLLYKDGRTERVGGVPKVADGGQGGLGDVIAHPDFATNGYLYLSYSEPGDGRTKGTAVARAKLVRGASAVTLEALQVIWRQQPKVTGSGHFGQRLAFGPDRHLWITSGERQKFTPAQDMQANLGKVLRLREDGSVPQDNPFAAQGGVSAQIWSLGHRNPLGIAFDSQDRLWVHEMGPRGGDELNLIERGGNFGYPIVSNGDHYDGRVIPDHATQPQYQQPKVSWTPVIAPAGMIIYSGSEFPDWQGDAFIGGLASRALIRIEFTGETAREAARYDMGERIREVEQGPDGAIWVLEDGSRGRLLRLSRRE